MAQEKDPKDKNELGQQVGEGTPMSKALEIEIMVESLGSVVITLVQERENNA